LSLQVILEKSSRSALPVSMITFFALFLGRKSIAYPLIGVMRGAGRANRRATKRGAPTPTFVERPPSGLIRPSVKN